ncbi:hypothetical protein AB1L12_04565 [Peribacillus frigoritolerans]|uniref:hypothetical protein n=1 Tax=Peribacillus frigoritolerans TaxID=450367 RepID=UPI0039A1776A
MRIDELNLNKKTLERLKDNFENVEELSDFFVAKGITALREKCKIGHKTISSSLLPELYGLGYIPPLWQQKEKEIGCKLLTSKQVEKELGIHSRSIQKIINSGHVGQGDFFLVGEELTAPSYQIYAFREDKIDILKSKYDSTLTDISLELGMKLGSVSYLLRKYLSEEEFKEACLTRNRWNRSWINDNKEMILERTEKVYRPKESDYTNLIGDDLTELVDCYITYRLENHEIVVLETNYANEKLKSSAVKAHRKFLINCLYKIKCNQAEIPDYWQRGEDLAFRKLSLEEQEKIKQISFDVYMFNKNDTEAISKGSTSDYFKFKQVQEIKPFVMYVLMMREEDYHQKLEQSLESDDEDFDLQKEWAKLKVAHNRILKALKHQVPNKRPEPSYKRSKFYASRQQVVQCLNAVKMNWHMISPIKPYTQLILGFFTAIRPAEMAKLKIENHLDIEQNNEHQDYGLLKKYLIKMNHQGKAEFIRTEIDNPEGWSRIWITKDIAKGEYSPSPEYGTLMVPRAAECLNDYLKWLYKQNISSKGKGLLFRPSEMHPYDPYASARTMLDWIHRYKYKMFKGVLSEDEIKDFTYYVARRTGNNLIVQTFISDQRINEYKLRAAEVHCRHEMKQEMRENEKVFIAPKGKTNSDFYQEPIPLWNYYQVLKPTLHFPFDKQDLFEWEKKNNDPHLNQFHELQNTNNNQTVEIDEMLSILSDKLDILRKHDTALEAGYKGESRINKIAEIKKQMDELLEEKNYMKGNHFKDGL